MHEPAWGRHNTPGPQSGPAEQRPDADQPSRERRARRRVQDRAATADRPDHNGRRCDRQAMSPLRDELHTLVDRLPEDRVQPVLALVRDNLDSARRKAQAAVDLERIRERMRGVTGVDEELELLRGGRPGATQALRRLTSDTTARSRRADRRRDPPPPPCQAVSPDRGSSSHRSRPQEPLPGAGAVPS
ncbi:hypothetical protein GCM10023259_034590 [Thermocatellispora tengchongensis]